MAAPALNAPAPATPRPLTDWRWGWLETAAAVWAVARPLLLGVLAACTVLHLALRCLA